MQNFDTSMPSYIKFYFQWLCRIQGINAAAWGPKARVGGGHVTLRGTIPLPSLSHNAFRMLSETFDGTLSMLSAKLKIFIKHVVAHRGSLLHSD
jgi:hypothetical protein